jgi:hypothetical protein
MTRKATVLGGQACARCNRTLAASSGVPSGPCQCTEKQIDQFLKESEADQKTVNRMLFISNGPQEVQKKHWGELQQLYRQDEQLAVRNGLVSPFGS